MCFIGVHCGVVYTKANRKGLSTTPRISNSREKLLSKKNEELESQWCPVDVYLESCFLSWCNCSHQNMHFFDQLFLDTLEVSYDESGSKEVWNQLWQLEIVMDCYESLRGNTCFSSPSNNLHIASCSSEGPFRTNGLHQEVALASWNLRGFWARYLILKILSIQLPKQSRDLQLFESTGRGVAFHSFVRESKSYRIYQGCIILHIVIRRKRNFVQWIAFIWLCSTHFILSFQRL